MRMRARLLSTSGLAVWLQALLVMAPALAQSGTQPAGSSEAIPTATRPLPAIVVRAAPQQHRRPKAAPRRTQAAPRVASPAPATAVLSVTVNAAAPSEGTTVAAPAYQSD